MGNREEILRFLAAQEVDIAVMGTPPDELRSASYSFAKNPMRFGASPRHPLMPQPKVTMADLAAANLLGREGNSGSRSTLTRLFREAGHHMRIGSELSSNEAIKQMCIAGFGPACLSRHTCVPEVRAGLLKLLPMPRNPIEREWFFVHSPSKQLPHVAFAFERFLRLRGQTKMDDVLEERESLLAGGQSRRAPRRRANRASGSFDYDAGR